MSGLVLSDPATLAVTAPNGTPVTITTAAGATLTGSVASNAVSFSGLLGQIIRTIMVGTGDFFAGDSTDDFGVDNRWTGTPNLSTSQRYLVGAYPNLGPQNRLRVSYVDPSTSAVTYRFDGYIDEWPTAWPTGGQVESTTTVTAVDLQSRIARQDPLDSVIVETYRLAAPVFYYPLDEAEGSTTAGDRVGSGLTLGVTSVGAGVGTIVFASGTGPGTDGTSAPAFTPTAANNGLMLTGTTATPSTSATGATLEAIFLTSATGNAQTVARWSDLYGTNIELGLDSTGHATATYVHPWRGGDSQTLASANVFADGKTHVAAVAIQDAGGGALTMTLTVDGTVRGTVSWAGIPGMPRLQMLLVGGSQRSSTQAFLFAGTISHVAGFGMALPLATLQQHWTAATTGFAGERSDQRIARIAAWAGVPTSLQVLDVGSAMIAHVDPTGKGPWDYMQEVTTTEAGVLFISTSGALTFYSRGRSYLTSQAVAVSVSAEMVAPDTAVVTNLAGVINDATVERTGGAKAQVRDAASVGRFGVLSESVTIISASDADAYDRAGWILATSSTPLPRVPQLGLDGLTDPSTSPAVRALDIFSRVAVTGMPTQSFAATLDLRVQGYTENIGTGGWDVTANTTRFLIVSPLIVDDPVFGIVDANNRAVY